MARIPRLLVDTNVFFSGIIYGGAEAELLRTVENGTYSLLAADFVIEEIRRIIGLKAPAYLDAFNAFLEEMPHDRVPHAPAHLVEDAKKIMRDPKDAPVLAAALHGKADCLVTGDKDFFTPEVRAKIRVATARELLETGMIGDVGANV